VPGWKAEPAVIRGEQGELGVGVAVTRDEVEDGPLTSLLADRGFRVYPWPTIRTAPPDDPQPLRAALRELEIFDWIVCTSPRAATALANVERPGSLRVAAVGAATAAALEDVGWSVDLVPDEQTGEALVDALRAAGVGDRTRILFPGSSIARDVVPAGLETLGARVLQVVAYRTEPAPLDAAVCRAELESGAVTVLTFTSPSTVQNLQQALGPEVFGLAVRRARAVAIGPTTAEAARSAGFETVAMADPHSLEGLADRVAELADRNETQEAH
jgi:uroporphyrinogen III methyltransferase/synthase